MMGSQPRGNGDFGGRPVGGQKVMETEEEKGSEEESGL